jgi:putative phosphotransacetylase
MENIWVSVPVAISATHVHLTPALIEELFCDKYQLREHSRLMQPTQYAAEESVALIGPMVAYEIFRSLDHLEP